ncbi:hypothetical protein M501DRAFT_728354 [Patellaria atrata CBS 101060]|uniref:Uncharacterized protein n=1 Tax=Patellaria atrata CBS 101060 TaxID=1346257 RepID=A0A9P4SC75_9PEZI|nr:hypothetical protein M501DRAFT_728354 [Patellaria atrata CBS 101060]
MLPPVDPDLFIENPNFKVLYQDLIRDKLNTDGSTKNSKLQKAQEENKKYLHANQSRITTNIILQDVLQTTARTSELPAELREVIDIVCSLLQEHISPEDIDLLEGDIEYFIKHIDSVGKAVSNYLAATALLLTRIAHPEEVSTEKLKSLLSALPETVVDLRKQAESLTSEIGTSRIGLTDLATEVLSAHRELLEAGIRIIEQETHGSVARGTKAKAEHLSSVAEGMVCKLSILARSQPADPELDAAMKAYHLHIRKLVADLQEREQLAEDALRQYGKVKGIKDVVAKYERLQREMATVKGDIERLESNSSR